MRSGFLAIVGLPNAGKSTLVNTLIGHKISIVTPKVQTTRRRVLGILNEDDVQLVLVDTPGIFLPKKTLEKAIVKEAWAGVRDADCGIVVVIDATQAKRDFEKNKVLLEKMPASVKKMVLFNKIDLINKEKLLPLVSLYQSLLEGSEVFFISALTYNQDVQKLKTLLLSLPTEGIPLFEDDQRTDLSLKAWAAEITREQIYLQLEQELPYEMTVTTDLWEEEASKKEGIDTPVFRVHQTIYLLKEAHKPIVLGRNGQQLKAIGTKSRLALAHWLKGKVILKLFVKIDPSWIQKLSQ